MRKKIALHSTILVLSIVLIAYTFMIPVYKYAWEPLLKHVNERGLLAQKLIHGFLIVVFVLAIRSLWSGKGWFKFAYIALLTFVCYRLVLFCRV